MVATSAGWRSREEAARILGTSQWRVSWLTVNGHLFRVQDESGRPGVTTESVEKYMDWQHQASAVQKVGRAMMNVGRWIVAAALGAAGG